MKLIIDIDENLYKVVQNEVKGKVNVSNVWTAIASGTPYEERPQGEWIDYSDEGYIECPFCGQATTCEDNIDELHYCWNCGAHLQKGGTDMRKPNCVTCDHFGKCEGCEKRDEE